MTATTVVVDQRVIGIDSRRFASVDKALVELVTNSDDSYTRLGVGGEASAGSIRIVFERHGSGSRLEVTDQAEGIPFDRAGAVVAYGGAHSPLARGEGTGRGYFGRGLKQAVFGLGHGWVESVRDGRLTVIDLFRDEDGTYLFDDHGTDRPVTAADRERLGIAADGTRVTVVVDEPAAVIPHYKTLLGALADNVYLREVLDRRLVELVHVQNGREVERCARVRHLEPPATTIIGPDRPATFDHDGRAYPYTLTLRRADDAELVLRGDERTNGLVVVSGEAVLDCQLFEYENQVGTEYLFGTVRCPALTEMLGAGEDVVGDARDGLNPRNAFVAAFARAVSAELAAPVAAERAKLRHLEHASTSHRTAHVIDRLLRYMSESAVRDLGVDARPSETADEPAVLRFEVVHHHRRPARPFEVDLLVHAAALDPDDVLTVDRDLPPTVDVEPVPLPVPVGELTGDRVRWTVTGHAAGDRGRLTARAGRFWASCEITIADPAPAPREATPGTTRRAPVPVVHEGRARVPRDHGETLFEGYELRFLHNERDRAVYDPGTRRILINTGAPTVRLYLDGRGHFRDSARLLLAELFLDVITGELARRRVAAADRSDDGAFERAKRELVRRYGADVHRFFA